jgi:hypothetical protein
MKQNPIRTETRKRLRTKTERWEQSFGREGFRSGLLDDYISC